MGRGTIKVNNKNEKEVLLSNTSFSFLYITYRFIMWKLALCEFTLENSIDRYMER
jgi:hypothetical protein